LSELENGSKSDASARFLQRHAYPIVILDVISATIERGVKSDKKTTVV
jgi:hypothetical protein